MTSPRVHVITCETRANFGNGTDARSMMLRSLRVRSVGSAATGVVTKDVCVGHKWNGVGTKLARIQSYVSNGSTAPNDLVLFTDSDVVFNLPLDGSRLRQLFDLARGAGRIVFQGEPWCFSPYGIGPHNLKQRLHCPAAMLDRYHKRFGTDRMAFGCARFLNFGAFAGEAQHLGPFMQLLIEPPPELLQGAAWRNCYRVRAGAALGFGGDQCVSQLLLLERPELKLTVDFREHLFATGAFAYALNTPRGADAPCGRTGCRPLGLNEPFPWEQRVAGTAEGLGRARAWSRPQSYVAQCSATPMPVVIHFNGPPWVKALISSPPMRKWLLDVEKSASSPPRPPLVQPPPAQPPPPSSGAAPGRAVVANAPRRLALPAARR